MPPPTNWARPANEPPLRSAEGGQHPEGALKLSSGNSGNRASKLAERLRSSAWTSLALRSAAFVGVLLVLAAIGRLSQSRPVAVTPATEDAGDLAPPPVTPSPPSPLTPVDAAPPLPASRARATPEDPVYLNHAGADDLRRLPGVGAKRADAILALRARVGRFQRVEELLRVKGVGRAMVRKWRPLVRLDSPARRESDGG